MSSHIIIWTGRFGLVCVSLGGLFPWASSLQPRSDGPCLRQSLTVWPPLHLPPSSQAASCSLVVWTFDVTTCHGLRFLVLPPYPSHTTDPSSRSQLLQPLPGLLSALCSQACVSLQHPGERAPGTPSQLSLGSCPITQDKRGWHGQGTYERWGEGPQRDRDAHQVTGCRAVHVAGLSVDSSVCLVLFRGTRLLNPTELATTVQRLGLQEQQTLT